MDFIDMLVNTGDEKLTGYFYKKRPKSAYDEKITFQYKQLDPNSRVFDKLLGEIRADSSRYAISTNDDCGFNIGGYIVTQNGEFWEITEVVGNEEGKSTTNALHWFKCVNNAEINIRMIKVNDLYSVQNAYSTKCEVIISFYLDGVAPLINSVSVESGEIDSYTIVGNEITVIMEKDTNVKLGVEGNNGEFVTTVSILKPNTVRDKNYITVDLTR